MYIYRPDACVRVCMYAMRMGQVTCAWCVYMCVCLFVCLCVLSEVQVPCTADVCVCLCLCLCVCVRVLYVFVGNADGANYARLVGYICMCVGLHVCISCVYAVCTCAWHGVEHITKIWKPNNKKRHKINHYCCKNWYTKKLPYTPLRPQRSV